MSELKVLHIVPWFPNPANEIEGVFIAKHIQSLKPHCINSILHLRFATAGKKELQLDYEGMELNRITLKPFAERWRIKEWMAYRQIKKQLTSAANEVDLVNFYIAYPNAIFIEKLKLHFPTLKFMLFEQWSAYHENFGLAANSRGKQRIVSIFNANVPLLVVSSALGEDIKRFTGQKELPFEVIPNSVDGSIFRYTEKTKQGPFIFCSINNWSPMKNPFILLEAFKVVHQKHPNTRLILAGSGQLDAAIKSKVKALQLEDSVSQKGRITKPEVITLLQQSHVYCQSSNYETFSAICIEALATGTPVIATNIGGMKDFIDASNGCLVDEMTTEAWATALEKTMLNATAYAHQQIAESCVDRFNEKSIGLALFKKIAAFCDEK